jgi:hypothetical protein
MPFGSWSAPTYGSALRGLIILGVMIEQGIGQHTLRLAVLAA